MIPIGVNEYPFEEVTVFGQPMIFSTFRINRDTIPKGFYAYDVRHDDEGNGIPIEIANYILVNHWGTVISKTPIKFADVNNPYRPINQNSEYDWNYEGKSITFQEYADRFDSKI